MPTHTSFFLNLLGAQADALPSQVRRLHALPMPVELRGHAQASAARGLPARLCAFVAGLPRADGHEHVLRAGQTNRVVLHGRNLPGGKPGQLTGLDGRKLEELAVEIVAPAAGEGSMVWPRRSSYSPEQGAGGCG